jgi:hypothetical protein
LAASQGLELDGASLDELEFLWGEVKRMERRESD